MPKDTLQSSSITPLPFETLPSLSKMLIDTQRTLRPFVAKLT